MMFRTMKSWTAGLVLAAAALSFAQAQTPPAPLPDAQPEHLYSQQELDQMLAPIALYPDQLLTQILMAATYPLEVVKAARWSRAHPGLEGDEAVRAAETEDWDPSVKSLVAFPRVLAVMDERIDWTEQLGEAFLSQEPYVLETIQSLRRRAYEAGNLSSNADSVVTEQGSSILIAPANPTVVYVPYYDPWVVYGTWWWSAYPPVYWAPWPGYVYPGVSIGVYWGTGIRISTGFFFGAFDWHRNRVDVVYVNNYYYRPRVAHSAPLPWHHEVQHRHGVPYRNQELRRRYPEPARQVAPRTVQPRVEPGRVEPRRTEPLRTTPRAPDVTRPAPQQRPQQFQQQQQQRSAPQQRPQQFQQQQQQRSAPQQRPQQFQQQQQQRSVPQQRPQQPQQYQQQQRVAPQSQQQQRSGPQSQRSAPAGEVRQGQAHREGQPAGAARQSGPRDAPDAGRGSAPSSGGRDQGGGRDR